MPEDRRFVIQQHDATRLHWDLPLERGGLLRSWALPRGVPWNPKENRLAVATEDHSLEFLDYEGEGSDPGYGAGRMTTWDSGTYETHKWEDAKVVVTLDGRRVSGKYALFSLRGSRDWLIHRMDPPDDARRVRVPIGVTPMTASDGEFPDDAGWVYEPCWHGIRALVTDDTGRVVITDDAGADISGKFPEVRRIGRALGHRELILDGVIVPIDTANSTTSASTGRPGGPARSSPSRKRLPWPTAGPASSRSESTASMRSARRHHHGSERPDLQKSVPEGGRDRHGTSQDRVTFGPCRVAVALR